MVMWLSSRVAAAAPRRATHRTRFRSRGSAQKKPKLKALRRAIWPKAMKIITPSRRQSRPSSIFPISEAADLSRAAGDVTSRAPPYKIVVKTTNPSPFGRGPG